MIAMVTLLTIFCKFIEQKAPRVKRFAIKMGRATYLDLHFSPPPGQLFGHGVAIGHGPVIWGVRALGHEFVSQKTGSAVDKT